MSFYEGRPRAAGYADVNEPTGTAVAPAAKPAEPGDWHSQRRSRPVDRLLPVASVWAAALPAPLRPRALIAHYPRIANLLALQWTDGGACPAYFDELLMDRRGRRQGFPPPVHDELVGCATTGTAARSAVRSSAEASGAPHGARLLHPAFDRRRVTVAAARRRPGAGAACGQPDG